MSYYDPRLNVFSGEDGGIQDLYNPDICPPTALVELPRSLNPLRDDGVRIYAKMMSYLPAANVKSLPALNMLMRAKEDGKITKDTHTIVESSSGSTIVSLGVLARMYGIPNVTALFSNKASREKLDFLRMFDVDIHVLGGPTQPTPGDPDGGIAIAENIGKKPGFYNPNQYANPANYEAHIRWTGPQLLAQLPEISVFASTMGTGGTMTGTGMYLKSKKPSVFRIGIVTADTIGHVPGPRSLSLLKPLEFPWRDAIDHLEETPPRPSFDLALRLCCHGLLVGPSSGQALLGMLDTLKRRKEAGTLDELRNSKGEINCVFIAADHMFANTTYYKMYTDRMEAMGVPMGRPVQNEELLKVDLHNYKSEWELTTQQAADMLSAKDNKNTVVLDLRASSDFNASHLPNALNLPVDSKHTPNPYQDATTLVRLSTLLEKRLAATDTEFGKTLEGKKVLLVSYKGRTALLAMSILRDREVEAYRVTGGSDKWIASGLSDWSNRGLVRSHL